MWAAVVVVVVLIAVSAVFFQFVPPPQALVVLRIRDGQMRVDKGGLPLAAQEHVAEILAEERIEQGWIAILANRRIACSRGIPGAVQQRLRNVLVNRGVN